MLSTMQDVPLTITRIMQHGTTVHGKAEVVTWTGAEPRRATYAEVGRRTAQLAHALRGLGVTGDQRVATFLWNNQEHLECYLAIPSMGAVLHTLNLRLPADQLIYIANHADDKVLVVDGSLVPLFAPALPHLKTVEHVVVTGNADLAPLEGGDKQIHRYDELIAGQPTEFPWVEDMDERSAAAMCYTSGTTGNPKGVVYSHRSTYLHSMQVCMVEGFGLGPGDTVLPVVPMFHVNAWGLPYAAMLSGASILMPDRFLQAEPLAAMIGQVKPTIAAAVPTIWTALLDHLDEHHTDVSSLREVIVGGSACPPALMEAFEKRHSVRVIHAWGMTETSPLGTVARPPIGLSGEEEMAYRVTQGRLPASVQARLVGPDGAFMPHDGVAVGELEVRGPWIAGGYVGGETGTDSVEGDRFHDGWLRTGDVGTLTPDGFLQLTDRAKDVIKSGGEWISSVELENHLMAHPDVAEAAVVGVPDERWGERPLATVVLRPGATTGLEELKEFLAGRVARWQVPERWSIVASVPKTSVGKFDKKVIRRQYGEDELDVVTL
ncbi:long-chain fatty acid--CoA ligase [Yinghuangia seranimata]|uniref:long-chain fatty acid--CoA ligase n=1 Tax=Yinghuangia seranimata TaxID=408067 RepID=UPI00248B09FC|nr:long-chain fatty acid--CoA ligase [Yinghuangia seranimata]MDI2130391.1 long-chain fatty acid--CoA ligase [Yinghuangia seranimata]